MEARGSRVEVIVKVGGAAITNKAVRETFKEDVAASIALMFKELHQQKIRAILIHGAGTSIKQNFCEEHRSQPLTQI